MDTPRGLQTPRRIALLVPLGVILLLVGIGIGFAVAHFVIKTPMSPGEVHARQATKGEAPHARDAYGVEDFSEPKEK
ncbi:MAG TPA: hypothetical protein VFF66_08535 [Brevundimonas sp.]|nr:hypothetical protein [Brevundimonas sp.]